MITCAEAREYLRDAYQGDDHELEGIINQLRQVVNLAFAHFESRLDNGSHQDGEERS